jgi:hypothetical protein
MIKLTQREYAILRFAQLITGKTATLEDVRRLIRMRSGCWLAGCTVKSPHDH